MKRLTFCITSFFFRSSLLSCTLLPSSLQQHSTDPCRTSCLIAKHLFSCICCSLSPSPLYSCTLLLAAPHHVSRPRRLKNPLSPHVSRLRSPKNHFLYLDQRNLFQRCVRRRWSQHDLKRGPHNRLLWREYRYYNFSSITHQQPPR